MATYIEGDLQATGKKFGIIVSRFNSFVSERLLEGALDTLIRSGAEEGALDVVRVPGAFEIPLMAQKMAESGNWLALIPGFQQSLGCSPLTLLNRPLKERVPRPAIREVKPPWLP
jgi:hypothetical protein